MFKNLVIAILLLSSYSSFCQPDDSEFDYDKEFTWGFNFNTNGGLLGGLNIKHATKIKKNQYRSLGLEIVNVKHPKEVRYGSVTGNSFIFGKQIYLYSLRTQYGREFVLFKKAPEEGVQINLLLLGGPTFGILAPYYIRYDDDNNNQVYIQYDPRIVNDKNRVLGTGKLFQGLNESKIKVGANLKTSLSFEFGTFKNNVAGFETGMMLEAFPEKIKIIPNAENRAIFSSVFFTLFYGTRK
jgi:hypothetical protein